VHGSKRDGDNGKRGIISAGDGTQKVFFHVHMMHEDHVQTINGDEVLEFLLRVLQCMDGEVGGWLHQETHHLKKPKAGHVMQFPH
jgi:cold shock CspA family protein